MSVIDARTRPLDPAAGAALAEAGLRYAQVSSDAEGFDAFLGAVARGFQDPVPTAEQIADSRSALSERRLVGVFDPAAIDPGVPVATVDSWVTELTTEPGRVLPMWAISAVTVAPTHRRRGIAREMLRGELQAAADAGLAVAGLTVTEATIYGRWGFSPAVYASDWRIDTRRAGWSGPVPPGRLDFIDQREIPERLAALHERVRRVRPGEVAGWPGLWRRTAGLRPEADEARKVRAVVYSDGGAERGILVYTLAEREHFGQSELAVRALLSETDDAAAALWRFAIEHDLVGTVTASLQPVDSPLRWMLTDQRAARVSVTDHEWLRVLDVPGALQARRYRTPLSVTIGIDDPLGFTSGRWRLEVDADGAADVARETGSADVDIRMSTRALSSLLLGGVAPAALASAGMVSGHPDVIGALGAAFAPAVTPLLSIWY
jgi:predicted acetyltransferase